LSMRMFGIKGVGVLLFLFITGSTVILAQNENILNGPKPLPGGKIAQIEEVYVELVFHPNDTSYIYLFDSDSKPLNSIKMIATRERSKSMPPEKIYVATYCLSRR